MVQVMSGFLKLNLVKAMYQKDKFLYFILIFFVIFNSCTKKEIKETFVYSRKEYLNPKFNGYSYIYNLITDSVASWKKDSLSKVGSIFYNDYNIDSIFLFNKDSSMLLTTVNIVDRQHKNATLDYIYDLYGRKINGKWYFFFGASTVLPREFYQDSVYSPLSFEELSYLAYKERFEYFVDNKKPLPEDFFDDVLGAYHCKPYGAKKYDRTQVNLCLDSLALATHAAYHAKKMTKEEIAEIQKAMDESVRPPESLKKSKEWWQFWKKEPAIPFFESEQWKNYLKQKYGKDWEKHR
jgi:hypothetical protein